MSHDLNLAIIAGLPVSMVAGVAAAVLVAIFALVVVRSSRAKKQLRADWIHASEELGIGVASADPKLGPTLRGRVNDHVVGIEPTATSGRRSKTQTLYSVKFEAPEAPKFRVMKRTAKDMPYLDTGHKKFDAELAVETENPAMLSRFLTKPRRAVIMRLVNQWPTAEITNRDARLRTDGIESDIEKLIDVVCHLVATAETLDRPSRAATASTIEHDAAGAEEAEEPVQDALITAPPLEPLAAPAPSGPADVLTELRVDEQTVIQALFDSGLEADAVRKCFDENYRGAAVRWSGEIVRVAPVDDSGIRRIAALIGSADGRSPHSGRVIAITTVNAGPELNIGDVVTFAGTLANLDVDQRLFHLA